MPTFGKGDPNQHRLSRIRRKARHPRGWLVCFVWPPKANSFLKSSPLCDVPIHFLWKTQIGPHLMNWTKICYPNSNKQNCWYTVQVQAPIPCVTSTKDRPRSLLVVEIESVKVSVHSRCGGTIDSDFLSCTFFSSIPTILNDELHDFYIFRMGTHGRWKHAQPPGPIHTVRSWETGLATKTK